jgi:hypothetical protein
MRFTSIREPRTFRRPNAIQITVSNEANGNTTNNSIHSPEWSKNLIHIIHSNRLTSHALRECGGDKVVEVTVQDIAWCG